MKKRIFIAFIGVLFLGGALAGIKYLQIDKMMAQSAQHRPQAQAVTSTEVKQETWEQTLTAVGSLSAVQGVTVAAELSGKVVEIDFTSGADVDAGALLVRQDATTEEALLPGAEATLRLAETRLARVERLLADDAVSQSEVDEALAQRQQALAEVKNLRATLAKKQVRAPFSGRLGIRQVNLGQMLEAGNEIVVLQSLDPIYVDFKVPQQQLPLLKEGLEVRVTTEELKTEPLVGKVTTISPKVDETTRNIPVQGVLRNPDQNLRPGMYVDVTVVLPEPKEVLVIPITAILYAPFGNSVFVIEPADTGQDGTPTNEASAAPPPLQLRQQFVRIGEKRGDFAEVLSGLKNGERVVTTGVFKLRNGQPVKIDNSLQPDFERNPQPSNK